MLKIQNRIGIPESKNDEMDNLEECLDKDHYLSYTKDISYRYNSRGFRDNEWPEDLSDVIWCVGDSFTVGIGQPFEETWPQILESKLGKRCINLGESGCSNDTMSLRIKEICKLHSPKLIVVMWSFFQRRRINNKNVHYDVNDFGLEKDMTNFSKNFKIVNESPTNIINLLVPHAFDDVKSVKEKYKNMIHTRNFDYARDYYHFGIKTSSAISGLIMKKISELDNSSKYPIQY